MHFSESCLSEWMPNLSESFSGKRKTFDILKTKVFDKKEFLLTCFLLLRQICLYLSGRSKQQMLLLLLEAQGDLDDVVLACINSVFCSSSQRGLGKSINLRCTRMTLLYFYKEKNENK